MQLKVFILNRKDRIPVIPLLYPVFGTPDIRQLFQTLPSEDFNNIVDFVEQPEVADCFLLPHFFSHVQKDTQYIDECNRLAKVHNKKILVIQYTDEPNGVALESCIIFRPSQYRSERQANEIIMPAFVEDIGRENFLVRKKSVKPTVSFVGRSGFRSVVDFGRYILKSLLVPVSKRDGRYFRRRLMMVCKRDTRLNTVFIGRKTYSGHANSVEGNPQRIREEYIDTLKESDFILAPKGDGNYSLRFFEALSMGRIPVFPDTDIELPLETQIPYKDISVRISLDSLEQTGNSIYDFYTALSDAQFEERQVAARRLFLEYLYAPSFFRKTLTKEFLTPFLQK